MASKKITSKQKRLQDKPLVFISHDTRDAHIAQALSDLVSKIGANLLESFRSSDRTGEQGIPAGADWLKYVKAKLKAATDIVCLLTPRSFARPWILYEAGLAEAWHGKRVLAIAVGLKIEELDLGPFKQFQTVGDDEASLLNVVNSLIGNVPDVKPHRDVVKAAIKEFQTAASTAVRTAPEPSEERHDLFVAVPMASTSEEAYARHQKVASDLVESFRKSYGLRSVYCAAAKITAAADFEPTDISAKDDYDAMLRSDLFVLLYLEKAASSALVEAGVALALRKPSLYLVSDRATLPFTLRNADAAFDFVRIYQGKTVDDFKKLIANYTKDRLFRLRDDVRAATP